MKASVINNPYLCLLIGIACIFFGRIYDISFLLLFPSIFFLRFLHVYSSFKQSFWILWICLTITYIVLNFGLADAMFQSIPMYIAVFSVVTFLGMAPYVLDKLASPFLGTLSSTLVFPAAKVLFEYVSSLNGPFGLWGSQASHFAFLLPFSQSVSVAGIWGFSFLLSWQASFVNKLWDNKFRLQGLGKTPFIYFGMVIVFLLFGLIRLYFFAPSGETVKVASITLPMQLVPRVDTLLKKYQLGYASKKEIREIQVAYSKADSFLFSKVTEAAFQGAKVVCWAEGNGSILKKDEINFLRHGEDIARKLGIYLAMSIYVMNPRDSFPIENKIVFIHPDGNIAWQYYKHNPFGNEKQKMVQGKDTLLFSDTPYGRISGIICYDTDFIQFTKKAGQHNIDLLLAPSSDWASIAIMRAKITVFRALENGLTLVRPTSFGNSIIADRQGRILQKVDYFSDNKNLVVQEIHTKGENTLYSKLGDFVPILCAIFLLAVLISRFKKFNTYLLFTIGIMLLLQIFSPNNAIAQSVDSTTISKKNPNRTHIYPILTFAPETYLGLGVSAFKLFKHGTESRTSNITATAIYTIRNQILIESATSTFFDKEKWLVKGRVNFKRFPEYFYGIGEKTSTSNQELVSYTYYNINGALLRNIRKGIFFGVQGTYNRYFNIDAESGGLIAKDTITGSRGATNIGMGATLLYDTRNNVLNTSKGTYIEISDMMFNSAWSSQFNYNAFTLDVRQFVQFKTNNVLAFQFLSLVKTGDVPFLQMSYLGGSDIMRGFYSGRYRDKDLIATQAEYRRQLTNKWGFVVFAGLANVSDKLSNFDFSSLKNSLGLGIRRVLDKKERVNLRLDVGFGDGQPNFYVNIAEAF